jgi:hypothetical protein
MPGEHAVEQIALLLRLCLLGHARKFHAACRRSSEQEQSVYEMATQRRGRASLLGEAASQILVRWVIAFREQDPRTSLPDLV